MSSPAVDLLSHTTKAPCSYSNFRFLEVHALTLNQNTLTVEVCIEGIHYLLEVFSKHMLYFQLRRKTRLAIYEIRMMEAMMTQWHSGAGGY